ncbi:MAG: YeeE/YedE family protein [Sphingomonadales bacterium]|nr:YeeE/YedE family protein [Sphingomonadales bacterium]
MAVARGMFRASGFAGSNDTLRHLMGAVLMGIGGVMALGCTVGQGISGVSTLAAGSFLAVLAIILGAVLGVRTLERWVASEA